MNKLLVDTNIVIDLLSKREGFYEDAQALFTFSDYNKVRLFISSLTIANTHYLLLREKSSAEARKILLKFKILAKVLPLDDKILELALVSDFRDFEDALQYHTALENDLDIIITRNKKRFQKLHPSCIDCKRIYN